jgi:hypothetical protein
MRLGIAVSVAVLVAMFAVRARAQGAFSAPGAFLGAGARGSGVQMQGHGGFRGGAARGRYGRSGFRGRRGYYHRGGYYSRTGFITAPYFYPPDYDSGYYEEPPETQAPPAQVFFVQTPAPSIQAAPAPAVDPLVLELHGDHWVRITDSGETEMGPGTSQPTTGQVSGQRSARTTSAQPAPMLPPAVLVFRDGHQEQTQKYTIIGPAIYTSANYWAGGSWRRKIPLAELDVDATLRLNQERGVRFNLPSSPNEVVIRP